MLTELQVVGHAHTLQLFMASAVVEIREPTYVPKLDQPRTLVVDAVGELPHHIRRDAEIRIPLGKTRSNPHLVLFDEREDLLVGDRVLVADNQELLPVLHELRYVLTEQRERRVGDDDVGFLEERDALGAAEVAPGVSVVALERFAGGLVALEEYLDVGHVRRAVAVLVLDVVEDDGQRLGLLPLAVALVVFRKQRHLSRNGRSVVAGGDELLHAELVEVGGEVLEEVALEGVIAVAVDDLVVEGIRIELEVSFDLVLDVDVLGVELVLLRGLGGAQASIHWFVFRPH